MARIPKKLREHQQFEIFREICEGAPIGTACVQECPDFLVRQHDAYIGIELTQYFKPTVPGRRALQEQHALQAMIVDRAQQVYESTAGRQLRANVLFRSQTTIDKRQCPEIASTLAAFVQECPITDRQQRFDVRHAGPELRMITAVYAYECPDRVRSLWRIATAGTLRPLSSTDVQSVIAGKEADVPGYDQRATQNWLVVVLDGSAASFAALTESALTHAYVSAFDQVHFLDIANGTCEHLHIAEPVSA